MVILGIYITLIVIMTLMWLVYLRIQNPGIVDVGWALCLMIAGSLYLFSTPMSTRQWLIMLLLWLWGLRLGGFLFWTRVRVGEIEKRYVKISEGWKSSKALGFFANYQLQAFLAMFIAVSFFWIREIAYFSLFDVIGLILVVIGIVGESVADMQLKNFKANHSGEVCNVGLWAYSRHPNYFFECLVWLGFAFCALMAPWGGLAFISPLALYLIMRFITGPITERGSLESRGDKYRDYQKNTPMIVPIKWSS